MAQRTAQQKNATDFDLVLGTAGHIDHGKSSLVLALTGTDPDRLVEEKKRGITIELGFAQLKLPDGRTMGVVDVPGHERFVRHMIAGATGIDVALLVVAADDGVMPQTVEHTAVLETLGISRCVVALTKTDMVDAEWVEFMEGEVCAFLKTTPYAKAPIVPVSAKTGAGLDDLRLALQNACKGARHAHAGVAVRFPIDRAFTIKGAGTVVTGTLWSGTVHPGDTLELLPQRMPCRVRSVQRHNENVEAAHAGNRVAMNLGGVSTSDVHPGDFAATPGAIEPSDRFDARFTYLDTAKTGKPLETGVRLHVAHGTREVLGRILFCDGAQEMKPGETGTVQLRLEQKLPLSSGDHFVVRTYSPMRVAGGGTVLLAHPKRRTNLTEGERVLHEALLSHDGQAAVEAAAALMKLPFPAKTLARYLDLPQEDARAKLDAAVASGRLTRIGSEEKPLFSPPALVRRYVSAIERALISFHAKNPTSTGMSKEELRQTSCPRADEICFDALLKEAIAGGVAVASEGLVGHPSAARSSQAAVDKAAEALSAALARAQLAPPALADLALEAGIGHPLARKAIARLEREGRAFRTSSELFFDGDAIEECKKALEKHLRNGGSGAAADLKDVMGTTRKYAIPLLERFDAIGFTVRDGNERRLGKQGGAR